jgi:hypothetical protein
MGDFVSGAARPYLTAGVALVSAAAAVVTPVGGGEVDERASSAAYSLTAASAAIAGGSLSNVPVNLVNVAMSIPAWEVQAMGRLADAMIATGSWQVWGPTNVFGFDEQDPPKLAAIVDMLVPIHPFSSVLGDQLNWWARANLPMNAGCAAAQNACPDPKAMLNSMFTVPFAELFGGHQFPVVANPFTGQETSWSGQYVKLDRGGAMNALRGYLTAPPVGVETVSAAEAATAISRLSKSIVDAFDPFVQNSQWFDEKHTVFAQLFRALAPALCASCDPTNPYDNEWLKNYPAKPVAAASRPVAPVAAPVAAVAVGEAEPLTAPVTVTRQSANTTYADGGNNPSAPSALSGPAIAANANANSAGAVRKKVRQANHRTGAISAHRTSGR